MTVQQAVKAALCLCAAGAMPAWSADSAINLDEVVVLGTQIEESVPVDLQKYGNRLEVISAEQLREGGFNDLGQALQMLAPGLYLSPKNGPFDYADISLLGGRTGDILFLIDGVRISNRLYNTTTPLDTIPAHMIERIEILKGGQGIFYGTQSVAGVVNIVTRSFSNDFDVDASAGLDTNDGKHVAGTLRGGFGNARVVAFGSVDKADGFQPFRDRDFQPSSTDRQRGYNVRAAGIKFGYEFAIPLTLSALYQHTDAHLDFAGPTETAVDYNQRNEDLWSVKLDWQLTDRFAMYLKSYYHDWTTHYTTIANDLNGGGQLTGTRSVWYDNAFWGFTDRGVNLMGSYRQPGGAEYVLGGDFQRYSGRDEVYTIAQQTEDAKAIFAQIRSGELLPDTNLALGARYNRTGAGETATVWNVSARHQLNDNLYLRGTGGTSLRLPDAYQLYGAFINEFDTRGNPDLLPEKSTNLDVGIGGVRSDTAGGNLGWELTLFTRKVTDLIGSDDDGFTDTDNDGNDDYDTIAVNTNGRVNMRGGELALTWNNGAGFGTTFDYTWSRARAENTSVQLPRIPEAQAKLGLNWKPQSSRYSAGVSLLYTGDVFRVVSGNRINYGKYWVADASVGYALDEMRRHRLDLSIGNILDKEYATGIGGASTDVGGNPYVYWNLGEPRTARLRYSFALNGG